LRTRAVISAFEAWDQTAKNWINLPAGTVVRNYHIGFNKKLGSENALNPYTAEFDLDSGRYSCPLHTFQARTELVSDSFALAEQNS
jgi:hypothetical protein